MLLQKQLCKSDIKKKYLLTEKQIDTIPFKTKDVIKYGSHVGFAHLYDEDKVISLALQIHGSFDNIHKLITERERKQIVNKIKRQHKALQMVKQIRNS